MKRVQHDLDVGFSDLAKEGDSLVGGVQNVVLKSVEYFQTEVNAEIGCEICVARNPFQPSLPVSRLVDGLGIVNRPIRMEVAADQVNVELVRLVSVSLKNAFPA
jgi:hypothetical protein